MSSRWSLCERDSGRIVVDELELATTFWRRFVGLQFRKSLPAGHGLLIAPCNSIHTHWMRFLIDAIFLDETGRVLAVRENIRPWRLLGPVEDAIAVLEVPANTAGLAAGKQVELKQTGPTPSTLPPSLYKWHVRTRPNDF